ncbi:MBL fold metallo-hydrolase [Alkalisalibacterium limincola]|uniref:MBL fold metallo-hydrolase n=1 Tax=Alkalisalibacterium limincola TaxID=2699169 RepID=A0A5C8KVJ5_9GAMM|nr:MBL fold metallo-hydrolase [Alkalisalibacterium limincola]TXK64330.1 MBL fold metallo-hydrolase [Alkalisalibacterium limincola]
MFLKKIKSEGLAHLSWIFGDGNEAFVVDPRRDCQVYVDIAASQGVHITRIFETHRNEDYVIGSLELSRLTGARIHHGAALDFGYGDSVTEGDTFECGALRLEILETPGHTPESISLVLRDSNQGDTPVGVFTGDALFIGDVGRTDLVSGREREMAEALYDTLFNKLLPLGDQTLIYPAHGAGSVCGENMASREFSTLGHERAHSPMLQVQDRERFVRKKMEEHHYQPRYFKKMEEYNLEGPPLLGPLPVPRPLSAGEVAKRTESGALLLDLRSPEAFASSFIPGSLSIPLDLLPAYGGYLLEYGRELVLLTDTQTELDLAVRHLIRMGFESIAGYAKGGLTAWQSSGRDYGSVDAIDAGALNARLEQGEEFTLLDVRKITEFRKVRLKGARHVFLGHLPDEIGQLDRNMPVVTFCGSGQRAIVAASILKAHGFEDVANAFGSMAACEALDCSMLDRSEA